MATLDTERQEILELLPWYVNDTLDETEARRVKEYLQRNPELANEVQFTAAVLDEANRDVQMPMLTHDRLRAVMDRIDGKAAEPSALSRLGAWLGSFAAPAPLWQGGVAAAAALLIAVVVTFSQPEQDNAYEVLTSEDPSALVLQVEFAPGIGDEAIQRLLQEFSLTVAKESGQTYAVTVPDEMRAGEILSLLQQLNADDRVTSAVMPKQE